MVRGAIKEASVPGHHAGGTRPPVRPAGPRGDSAGRAGGELRGDGRSPPYRHVTDRKVREERQQLPAHTVSPRVPAPYGQQVPPLGQQKVSTSETQSAVHPNDGSQHVGSWAQTAATQGSLQPVEHSAAPAVQTSWHWQVGCVVVVVGVVEVVGS